MDSLLKYKIAISLVKGLGPRLIRNVIAYLGSIEAVFTEKERVLAKIPGVGEKQASVISNSHVMERAEEEIEFVLKNNIRTHFFLDDGFPARLNNCDDGPVMLYSKGKHALTGKRMLAVVGTRKVTEDGKRNCRNFICELSKNNPSITIVSGLAYGVDICAHRAALEFGLPTIAVLAHGLDRIYPKMHTPETEELMTDGALLTEYRSGTVPDKPNFVKRNRIVAGLTDATLVVESAIKGGALITAYLAQSYNRDVLALPGRVDDEFSKGCNKLIKSQVAAMVENAEDLLYALNWEPENGYKAAEQLSLFEEPTGEAGLIYKLIKREKEVSVNFLSVSSGIPVSRVSSLLLKLEFDGLLKSLPGNRYRCL
ncbi:DNA-processing protein DprA [Saccharicrinis fermentans]|uniref:Uncharacterized protein n=1 Tax=Saccharicrinis fermentans DSM 9555 = JCM 21142 TaxID=869213 RepID=W7XYC3_9BACT|nr:DNA-processing protein DprA [Saccharicrinis fermentans]GAF03585.1 hypothetical protein JCM21142_52263 [Saccharicrinis fermentans DSM 9555 = JCM 21142]